MAVLMSLRQTLFASLVLLVGLLSNEASAYCQCWCDNHYLGALWGTCSAYNCYSTFRRSWTCSGYSYYYARSYDGIIAGSVVGFVVLVCLCVLICNRRRRTTTTTTTVYNSGDQLGYQPVSTYYAQPNYAQPNTTTFAPPPPPLYTQPGATVIIKQ